MSAIFPTIAVIVVNWNGWRDTVKAYTSLRRSSYTGWRLTIVDNASTDGGHESVQRLATVDRWFESKALLCPDFAVPAPPAICWHPSAAAA